MQTQRVTIRNVQNEAICALREVARHNRMSLGEATTEAIECWLASLSESAPNTSPSVDAEWTEKACQSPM